MSSGQVPDVRDLTKDERAELFDQFKKLEQIYRPQSYDVQVPDLVNLPEAEAVRAIRASELAVGTINVILTESEVNRTVVAQNPKAAGRVKPNTRIDISVQVQQTTVPNLEGKSRDEAEKLLTNANLTLGNATSSEAQDNKLDTVIEQEPKPGAIVPAGSAVDVVIGMPKENDVRPNPPTWDFGQ
jgi:beta-lactam-binding protein with PASTA domain